ncbi:MAG: hypothetical protein EHM49_07535 [Deltaproteobacteria bacterium]|nr:MAG: hypothetical protein EHM49_07535 [Deltaproteobacteria bacterium]
MLLVDTKVELKYKNGGVTWIGIRCKQIKKFKATTTSKYSFPVAENLLHQQFQTTVSNQVWVSDLTYIPTEEGWLYCAAHKDLFNGEIVGYALGPRITIVDPENETAC